MMTANVGMGFHHHLEHLQIRPDSLWGRHTGCGYRPTAHFHIPVYCFDNALLEPVIVVRIRKIFSIMNTPTFSAEKGASGRDLQQVNHVFQFQCVDPFFDAVYAVASTERSTVRGTPEMSSHVKSNHVASLSGIDIPSNERPTSSS